MAEDDQDLQGREDGTTLGSRVAEDLSVFIGLTTDFYRGEIDRATAWRARLDQTTNWAVVVVAAVLTWAFSGESRPHYVVLIGIFAITTFLFMEANRYREYDVWRDRVRAIQTGLMAEAFSPGETSDSEWRTQLGDELRNPDLNLSFWEALNHRLRRSYLALLAVLLLAWVARITVFIPEESWQQTAAILFIPGEVVVVVVCVFYALLTLITAWSARGRRTEEFQR